MPGFSKLSPCPSPTNKLRNKKTKSSTSSRRVYIFPPGSEILLDTDQSSPNASQSAASTMDSRTKKLSDFTWTDYLEAGNVIAGSPETVRQELTHAGLKNCASAT
ncbi:MAG: hypothetical protein CM1200mP22_15890 [Dehalococcoidia bacterium]|nr:MAG: hypothetical protein CM1200mP22_15890 [Dehalococcoidia bacterium]